LDADINVHARNLKLVSIAFILYWLLGLEQTEDVIRLGILPYKITNPEWLPWLAHLLFSYFIWRYWIHTNSKRTLFKHLINQQSMGNNEVPKLEKYNLFWKLFNACSIKKFESKIHDVVGTDPDTVQDIWIDSIQLVSDRYEMVLKVKTGNIGQTINLVKKVRIKLEFNDLIFFRIGLIFRNFFKRETEQDRLISWLLAWLAVLFSMFHNLPNLIWLLIEIGQEFIASL